MIELTDVNAWSFSAAEQVLLSLMQCVPELEIIAFDRHRNMGTTKQDTRILKNSI